MPDLVSEDDVPLIEASIQDNAQQRTPCVLVLDCSSSMEGDRMAALNRGLQAFRQALLEDETALQRVVVEVVVCGGDAPEIALPWTPASSFQPPLLQAIGRTPLGAGMALALDEIERVKRLMREYGTPYTRPWIFLMTDGAPNDLGWTQVAERTRQAVECRRVIVWPIAVPGANAHVLRQFAGPDMPIYEVEATRFVELFQWLSTSLVATAASRPGERLQLPAPSTITIDV
jgi:uncharacterized protein YegL